jgi:hypothetical protein
MSTSEYGFQVFTPNALAMARGDAQAAADSTDRTWYVVQSEPGTFVVVDDLAGAATSAVRSIHRPYAAMEVVS